MSILVSFDVDGTLIRSTGSNANKLHRDAFSAAFKTVFGLDTTIDVIPHHGSTDTLILVAVLEAHGIDKSKAMEALPELQRVMNEHFLGNPDRAGEGLEVLPGVVDLLKRLQADERFHTCLVTGNLEPIGWGKMDALGIGDLFTQPRFGGFGSDYCSGNTTETWRDRAEFVRLADEKGRGPAGKAPGVARVGWPGAISGAAFARRVHVGDAPMDVQAAADAGAVPLGVTTGIYTREQLEQAAPSAIILEGLHDLEQVLHVLEGST